jgi:multidrug efflux pump subunit AcrA (membrane-fusion protein)
LKIKIVKHTIIYIILLVFILPECTRNKPNIITYDLKYSDYIEAIDAIGTIQAVNNMILVAPRINISNFIKVAHLEEEGTYVRKGDTVCILDAPELIVNFESLKTDLEKMEADMNKLEADNAMQLSLLEAQVKTNEAQMAISMLDSIQIKFAPQVKQRLLELELEKTNVEKKKLQKKFAAQKRINNSDLAQINSRIMMQKNRIQTLQNQINSLKIVAPCDGIVMHIEGRTFHISGGSTLGGKIEEGSSVFSNMSLLQIPDIKQMQVLVEVPEADFKRLKEEQKVLIRVEAAANLITTGKIERKTLAGINTQEETAIKTYEVIISVDSCHSMMKPGLSASCRIIIDQVKDTIVVPAAAIFMRDSSKIVYVADGGKFIPVTVETGFSNSSKSIISKGLAGNETIALIEPPQNLIRKEIKSKADKKINSGLDKKDSVVN